MFRVSGFEQQSSSPDPIKLFVLKVMLINSFLIQLPSFQLHFKKNKARKRTSIGLWNIKDSTWLKHLSLHAIAASDQTGLQFLN